MGWEDEPEMDIWSCQGHGFVGLREMTWAWTYRTGE